MTRPRESLIWAPPGLQELVYNPPPRVDACDRARIFSAEQPLCNLGTEIRPQRRAEQRSNLKDGIFVKDVPELRYLNQ